MTLCTANGKQQDKIKGSFINKKILNFPVAKEEDGVKSSSKISYDY